MEVHGDLHPYDKRRAKVRGLDKALRQQKWFALLQLKKWKKQNHLAVCSSTIEGSVNAPQLQHPAWPLNESMFWHLFIHTVHVVVGRVELCPTVTKQFYSQMIWTIGRTKKKKPYIWVQYGENEQVSNKRTGIEPTTRSLTLWPIVWHLHKDR